MALGLDIASGHRVLDLGCGDGTYLTAVAHMRPRSVIAMDLSLADLRQARTGISGSGDEKAKHGWVCGDLQRLPFADASFDRVICALVLDLVPIHVGLAELARVMTSGGRAYVRVPALAWSRIIAGLVISARRPGWVYRQCAAFNGAYFAVTGRQIKNPVLRHDHWKLYMPASRFRAEAGRAGLSVERCDVSVSAQKLPTFEFWLAKQ